MNQVNVLVDKWFIKLNIIPISLVLVFTIFTIVIVWILIKKELKKVGSKNEKNK